MPTSASFVIRSFEASYASSGSVERILALTVACGHCSTTTTSTFGSLMELPGGALFRCGQCGSHHAVSNARLSAIGESPRRTAQPPLAPDIQLNPRLPVFDRALAIAIR
jgi:hypothetical protein